LTTELILGHLFSVQFKNNVAIKSLSNIL